MNGFFQLVILLYAAVLTIDGSVNEASDQCKVSSMACLCKNIENITEKSIDLCCKKPYPPITLVIYGSNVTKISIGLSNSVCSGNFTGLVIRETSSMKLTNSINGLYNVENVFIKSNKRFNDFHDFNFASINKNISTIVIEGNSLRTIVNSTFKNLENLATLKLFNNHFGYIEKNSFKDLKRLKNLYLNNNLFTALESDAFIGLSNLEILDLTSNPLHRPREEIFKHLKNLLYLKMSLENKMNIEKAGFNSIPIKFFYPAKKLRDLNMTQMKIENLTSASFYGLTNLKRLIIPKNQLEFIPKGTFQQINQIEHIDLSSNKLKCLFSNTFKSLPQLKTLNLFGNQLSYISEAIMTHLGPLQVLDLRENSIYVIEPNAFYPLKSLMILKLNIVMGSAHYQIDTKFAESPLAKLSNTTKISGMVGYFGIEKGLGAPKEPVKTSENTQTKNVCLEASKKQREWNDFNSNNNRKHLLIIVGICVLFLLIALAVIMTYRAWSKRKMNEYNIEANGNAEADKKPPEALSMLGVNGNNNNNNNISSSNNSTSLIINNNSINNKPRPKSTGTNCSQPIEIIQDGNKRRSFNDEESSLTPLGVL